MITTTIRKEKFQKYKFVGNNKVLVRINEREDGDLVTCDELLANCFSKDALISSLVRANYPSDLMDAVRNNHELVRDGKAGNKTAEYTMEYETMQEWRKECKELAAEIMNSKKR